MARTETMQATAGTGGGSAEHLWEAFYRTRSEAARNDLLEQYLPLVRQVAERMSSRMPDEIEVEDLVSAGLFGLMDAIDGFDPDRGVKFETYCSPRIRGAILDEMRSLDWVPRLVRARTTQMETARRRLEMGLGRSPTDDEIASELNLSPEEFERVRKDAGAVGVVSLDRKRFDGESDRDAREIDLFKDPRQANPMSVAAKRDLKAAITRGLTRAERLIVMLYYFEDMTMKEIGKTLDLSESRVSQMHTSILARLRAQLQQRDKTEL